MDVDQRIQDLTGAILGDRFRPDEKRKDWAAVLSAVDDLDREWLTLISSTDSANPKYLKNLIAVGGWLAAIRHCADDRQNALVRIRQIQPIAKDAEQQALLKAAEAYTHAFAELQLALWHQQRGEMADAIRVAERVADHPAPALSGAALALTGRKKPRAGRVPRRKTRPFDSELVKTMGLALLLVSIGGVIFFLASPSRDFEREVAAEQLPVGPITPADMEARMVRLEALMRKGIEKEATVDLLVRPALLMMDLMDRPLVGESGPQNSETAFQWLARLNNLPEAVKATRFETRLGELVRSWLDRMSDDNLATATRALRLCMAGKRLSTSDRLRDCETHLHARIGKNLVADGWIVDGKEHLALAGLSEETRGNIVDPEDRARSIVDAQAQFDAGDVDGALKTLTGIGVPGSLTRDGQRLYVDLMEEKGDWLAAEKILERIVWLDFPEYEQVREAYHRAFIKLREQLYDEANRELSREISDDGERAQRLVDDWVEKKLNVDTGLGRARDLMRAHAPVVGLVMRLGSIRLARASSVTADERVAILKDAEQDYLMIASDAGDSIEFHLDLGLVYHRLGKPEKGDEEFEQVLTEGNAELDLRVARSYRDLGLEQRARVLAKKVFETNQPPIRYEAAKLLSLLADTEIEQARWLKQSDPEDPTVKADSLQAEGHQLAEQGEWKDADARLLGAFSIWNERSARASDAANNAALLAMNRYRCNGDRTLIKTARKLFETAMELAPTSYITATNAASNELMDARLEWLERWIDTSALHLSQVQADILASALIAGSLRDETLRFFTRNMAMKRGLAASLRGQRLAPGDPYVYQIELDWLADNENRAALDALATRVREVKVLNSAPAETPEESRANKQAELERRERQIRLFQKIANGLSPADGSPRAARTQAALYFLRFVFHSSAHPDLKVALQMREQARALWPELGSASDDASTVLALALDEIASDSSELSEAWKAVREDGDPEFFVYERIVANDTRTKTTLASHPAIVALGARMRSEQTALGTRRKGRFADFLMGTLLGDPSLKEIGRAYLTKPETQIRAQINQTLWPESESVRKWVAIVDSVAKAVH